MKLTTKLLKKLIKEELTHLMREEDQQEKEYKLTFSSEKIGGVEEVVDLWNGNDDDMEWQEDNSLKVMGREAIEHMQQGLLNSQIVHEISLIESI
jgi:hypothetical protein